MPVPACDDELSRRQLALQAEARDLLDELDRLALFAHVGPLHATGSYVSGLMCWRDLDVMVLVGPDYAPRDVLRLLQRFVELPGVVGFEYRDERGPRSPTGQVRDERYHVPVDMLRESGSWRVDLSLWLHDAHASVTAWHESLRDRITPEQRDAVLRIKDVWHRLPSYPDRIGGQDIYTAVLNDAVRTPEQFAAWLAKRGLPSG
jgi:hypothetical protein